MGQLLIFVAFDWGDGIQLERARQLAPAASQELPRRPRTPTSIVYNPAPLRFTLTPAPLPVPGLPTDSPVTFEATLFDFAAVSVSVRIPFTLTHSQLTDLAGQMVDPPLSDAIVQAARAALTPLYEKLLPAIQNPLWHATLSEEYFVFLFPAAGPLRPDDLLTTHAGWLAGLVQLEDEPLHPSEIAEACRLALQYGRQDLLAASWAAAFLLDREAEASETLQIIELANVQLLEYRHIDNRLDGNMERAQQMLDRTLRAYLPFWRSYSGPLRLIGDMKVEAAGLFERTGNVLKLIGDPYVTRAYHLLVSRFHLGEWEASIQRKLEVIEGVYQVLSDQTVAYRAEFLEIIIILLILVEIVLTLLGH